MKTIRVCFVCLGNICRSPLAEGAFRRHVEAAGLADRFEIDSAGTGHWHAGEPPDPRSVAEAKKHGVDISRQRARQFVAADLQRFDVVCAMDGSNLRNLLALGEGAAEVAMLLDEDVPDPYYGRGDGFARVWSMVDRGCADLLAALRARHGL
ncbi:MAG: low molecular weight phosphotyrosine protein phosphatase [Myxococcales bacterium]|nr:low molecular weight phosphotyrosine protein phosphatase [Myxococcales bacterium]